MTVYVDDVGIAAAITDPATNRTYNSSWSHLVADSREELVAFARRLGLRDEWIQEEEDRPWMTHYDVTTRKRAQAIRLGAKAITWREMGERITERLGGI